jgi:NADPH:quinone reductase-like Zn-dependent oxidoreductase
VRAVHFDRFGPAREVLRIVDDQPTPLVRDGEILIRVEATSVNPIDCAVRSGYGAAFFTSRGLMQLPLVPGRDVAGTVQQLGPNVEGFRVGDRVFAGVTNFATAEIVRVPVTSAAPMPRSLSFTEAASLPYVALTTWAALVDAAGLTPETTKGKHVIVPRGAGGVGCFAIQLMKAWGASVASTCSTKNVEFVRGLGADVVVDYTKEDVGAVLSGYDVAFDTTFDLEPQLLGALKTNADAVYVSVVTPKIRLTDEFGVDEGLKRAQGLLASRKDEQSKLGRRYEWAFMEPNGAALAQIGELVDSGRIRPVIDSVFEMERIAEAHERCDTKKARGKIVVTITPAPQS